MPPSAACFATAGPLRIAHCTTAVSLSRPRLCRRRAYHRHGGTRVTCVETPPTPPPTPPFQTDTDASDREGSAESEARAGYVHPLPVRGSLQEDVAWTAAWISVAAVTAGVVYMHSGVERMAEFVTAYVVEYSLSVDNLFVFLVIFRYFGVERRLQLKALEWGIGGAVIMRGVMVFVGEALVHRFRWVSALFGALLVYTAATLLSEGDDADAAEDIGDKGVVGWVRRVVPVSAHSAGDRFWTRQGGTWMATPLLVVVLCIELSDVVFALDSVPAVLGVSRDAAVVYVSNLLAVVGLRNLYFVLSEAIGELRFLRFALAGVLAFVGGKMVGGVVGGWDVGVGWSLAVVLGVLGAGVGASLAWPAEPGAHD